MGERIPFFRRTQFVFTNELKDRSSKQPKVEITMPRDRYIIMELAANGFGSPEVLYNERVDLIMDAYEYLTFKFKYESQSYLLARDE